jgi:hypothetical protein
VIHPVCAACGGPASVLTRVVVLARASPLFFRGARVNYGSGSLFLTTENITWISASDAGKALSFHWRSVLMHAISRDTSSFPHPCIYCQVRLARSRGAWRDAFPGAARSAKGLAGCTVVCMALMSVTLQVRKSDTPMVEGHANGDAAGQAAAGGAEEEEEEEEPGMMPDEEITRDVRYVLDDPEVRVF